MIVSASQDLLDGCRKRFRLAAAANDCCRPQRVRARSCAFQQARSSDAAAWQRAVSVLHERLHSYEGHHSLNEYPPLSSPSRRSPFRDARFPRVSLIFASSSSSPWDRTLDWPFCFSFLSLSGPINAPPFDCSLQRVLYADLDRTTTMLRKREKEGGARTLS